MSTGWHNMTARARHIGRSRQRQNQDSRRNSNANSVQDPVRPLPVASPVSRANTTSAASTVYVVRYSEPTPPIHEDLEVFSDGRGDQPQHNGQPIAFAELDAEHAEVASSQRFFMNGLQWLPNPFRRQRTTPPPEVVRALAVQSPQPGPFTTDHAHQSSLLERLHLRKGPKSPKVQRAVIVIPAPARGLGSVDHESGSLESGDENERDTDSTCTSTDRDTNLPPEAVLNAINTSQHTST